MRRRQYTCNLAPAGGVLKVSSSLTRNRLQLMSTPEIVHHYSNPEAKRFDGLRERVEPLPLRVSDTLVGRASHDRYSPMVSAIGAPGASLPDVGCGPRCSRRGAGGSLRFHSRPKVIEPFLSPGELRYLFTVDIGCAFAGIYDSGAGRGAR